MEWTDLLSRSPLITVLITLFLSGLIDAIAGVLKDKAPFWLSRRLLHPWQRYFYELLYLRNIIFIGKKDGWNKTGRWAALQSLHLKSMVNDQDVKISNAIEESLKKNLQIIIMGESGSGKTVAIQAFVYRLADQAYRRNIRFWSIIFGMVSICLMLPSPTPWIGFGILLLIPLYEQWFRRWSLPILLEGSAYGVDGKLQSFKEFLQQELSVSADGRILADDIDHFINRRRLAVFFDGINEISFSLYEHAIELFAKEIDTPFGEYHQIPLIITSRLGTEGDERLHLASLNLNRFILMELDNNGVRIFLQTYGLKDIDAKYKKLEYAGFLKQGGLARNPFWLEKVAETDIYSGNAGETLRKFVVDSLERELRKPKKAFHRSIIKMADEQSALAYIASTMIIEGAYTYKKQYTEQLLTKYLSMTSPIVQATLVSILEEAEGAFLIDTVGNFQPKITFRHEWLRYYFAAWSLRNERNDSLLAKSQDRRWWRAFWLFGGITREYSNLIHLLINNNNSFSSIFLGLGLLLCGRPKSEVVSLYPEVFHTLNNKLRPIPNPLPPMAAWLLRGEITPAFNEQIIELCLEQLQEGNDIKVKSGAALALGVFQDERAIIPLIESFLDVFVTPASVEALVSFGNTAAPKLTDDAKNNKSELIRRGALLTLGKIQGIYAADLLINAFDDSSILVREAAVEALVPLGEGIIPKLEDALKSWSYYKRFRSVVALELIKGINATAALLVALKDRDISVRERTIEALKKMGEKNLTTAFEALVNPEDLIIYGFNLVLAECHYSDREKALEYYKKAEIIRNDDALLYYFRGVFLSNFKEYEQSLADLNKAIEMGKNHFCYLARGNVYFSIREYQKAILDYDETIRYAGHSTNYQARGKAYFFWGETYSQWDRFDDALMDFNKAIELDPSNPDAYYYRGRIYDLRQDYQSALQNYEYVIDLNPRELTAFSYSYRAIIFYKLHQYEQSITDGERAIELGYKKDSVFSWLGAAYKDSNQLDKALVFYKKVLEINPDDPIAHINSASILESQGKIQDALHKFEKYLLLNPNNPQWEQYANEHIQSLKKKLEGKESKQQSKGNNRKNKKTKKH
jgi:tetratricopeptide (TPR) repeat protein